MITTILFIICELIRRFDSEQTTITSWIAQIFGLINAYTNFVNAIIATCMDAMFAEDLYWKLCGKLDMKCRECWQNTLHVELPIALMNQNKNNLKLTNAKLATNSAPPAQGTQTPDTEVSVIVYSTATTPELDDNKKDEKKEDEEDMKQVKMRNVSINTLGSPRNIHMDISGQTNASSVLNVDELRDLSVILDDISQDDGQRSERTRSDIPDLAKYRSYRL